MRKTLGTLVVLAAALLAAPVPTASSASGSGADRVGHGAVAERGVSLRDQVIALTNDERLAAGCHALQKNAALGKAAQRHTKRMANVGRGGSLSHQLSGEASLGTRVTNAGYRGWNLVGENIAKYSTTAADVMAGWMASHDHRANILNCRYKHIGVGFARAANGTAYWTQDFGRR